MLVKFIAHAGVAIEEDGFLILIDPWFFDSTPENPVIESIGGGFKTIDFQIPKTGEDITLYKPDAILVSHFHPHHSPVRDITELFKNSLGDNKEILIGYPAPNDEMERALTKNIPPSVKKKAVRPNDEILIGPFKITAKKHTVPFHTTWYITSKTGSVLHIADGRINKDIMDRRIDDSWVELQDLKPSVLFISSGGHSQLQKNKEGEKIILEAGIFTAVEAAKVTRLINPTAVALIGMYNHSIWKNRIEYIRQASQVEDEFFWALTYLDPNIKKLTITPGFSIGLSENDLEGKCNYFSKK